MKNNRQIQIRLCPKNVYVMDGKDVYKIPRTEWESFKAKGMSDKEAAQKVIEAPRKHIKRETIIVNI